MTTGIINGNNLVVYQDDEILGCTTESTLSINRETIDATCKDNDGARQILSGSVSWTITASGLVKFDNGAAADVSDRVLDGASVDVKFGMRTESAGDFYFTGAARITNVEISSPQNAPATWSATFEGDGPLTKTVIPTPP